MTGRAEDDCGRRFAEETIFPVAHVERLSKGLQRILLALTGRDLDLVRCIETVAAGCSLSRHGTADGIVYMGRPWSTAAALMQLAGLGYVLNPRDALQALKQFEADFIIDRRRLYLYPGAAGRWQNRGSAKSFRRRNEFTQRSGTRRRPTSLLMGDGRFLLGYVLTGGQYQD